MKKFIIIPDSFKGTLSSQRICDLISGKIKKFYKDSEIISLPVADGGEGTVDCFLSAVGGKKVFLSASNPFFEKIQSFYADIGKGIAVVETASCAGLPLIEDRKNPLKATTYGVGETIKCAIDNGAKEIIIGLGGLATNDFGCGLASRLGVKFFDKDGKEFIPVGGTLSDIERIDLSTVDEKVKKVKFTAMCDVDNPPYGERGAARIFARQKGANDEEIELLDRGVKHVCDIIKRDFNKDLSTLCGGGAAGGLGAGLYSFFGAELKSGIQTVLDIVKFDDIISDADLIFTGEGKIDSQSLNGKVVVGVSRRAKIKGVPVIAVVGGADGDMSPLYNEGVTAVFPINRLPQDLSVSKYKSEENLSATVEDILRLTKQN